MNATPLLPEWITQAKIEKYETAHVLVECETRLYGTEDLYGDWDARALLLAKDFSSSEDFRSRIDAKDPRPYRHDPKCLTNKRLRRFAGALAASSDPSSCGLLYGSALANLLRGDGRMSGPLPNWENALLHGVRVLSFVRESMPNLRTLVCMGWEAYAVTQEGFKLGHRWDEVKHAGRVLSADGLRIVVVPHPAARGPLAAQESAWEKARAVVAQEGGRD